MIQHQHAKPALLHWKSSTSLSALIFHSNASMGHFSFQKTPRLHFNKFRVADTYSTKNQQMAPQTKKKRYPPGYNLLFDITAAHLVRYFLYRSISLCLWYTMPNPAYCFEVSRFYLFVPSWISVPSQLILLVCTIMNLRTYTVDFVITFYAPYITYIFVWISQPKTFSSIKNRIVLHWLSLGMDISVVVVDIFLVPV